MTEQDAVSYIKIYAEAERDPLVSETEIQVLFNARKCGGAWDLEGTILDIWRAKLGRCSDYYDVTIGGRDHTAEQIFKHCQEMVKLWEKRVNSSVKLATDATTGDFLVVANYNEPLP